MPRCVLDTIQQHLELEAQIGGYEAAAACEQAVSAAYEHVARLIGARAGNIAFTENATASYAQALSSILFEPDDVILTTRNDYVSNQIQFLALQARLGLRVVRAPDLPEEGGGVDVSELTALIEKHGPKLVCVTHVPTSSGLIQDIAAVGQVCRQKEIIYLVDACQSIGQLPIDVSDIACDFLSATSRKFLRGPRGSGFLYVSDEILDRGLEPLFIDLKGADWIGEDSYRPVKDAKRFENWEFAWALVLGTGEAARYAMDVGVTDIRDRVQTLSARLRVGLDEIDRVRVLQRGGELSAVVTVWVEGWEPHDLVAALRDRKINTSAQSRTDAVIDYDGKGVSGALRLSPHYYNTEDEIDEAVSAIRALTY